MPSHLETTAAVRLMERHERLSVADRRRLLAGTDVPTHRAGFAAPRGLVARTLVGPCQGAVRGWLRFPTAPSGPPTPGAVTADVTPRPGVASSS